MASRKLCEPSAALYQEGRGSDPMIEVGNVTPADALYIWLLSIEVKGIQLGSKSGLSRSLKLLHLLCGSCIIRLKIQILSSFQPDGNPGRSVPTDRPAKRALKSDDYCPCQTEKNRPRGARMQRRAYAMMQG